jgi:hypothetical protein
LAKTLQKKFNVANDIYLCYMYNPPANSTYTQSSQEVIFDLIENDLHVAKYSEKGNILIMGDLNARTSDDNDFIQNDSNDNTVQQYDDYTPDVEIINRFSRDTVLLPRGRTLNDMCIQTGLIILNGRCIGDLTGNFTCHNFHGSSVVDYACASECLLPKLKLFSVHNFLPDLSDHCQISLMMRINCTLTPDDNQTYPLPVRYKWNENSPFLFQEALSKPNSQTKIESINNTNYDNVDCLVEDINLVLCNAANAALSKSCNKPKKNTTKPPKWYDQTLNTLKKNLIQK